MFCGDVCGGTCAATAGPSASMPRLGTVAHEVQIAHAAGRVRAIVEGLGTPVPIAARHVARRMALDPRDVLRRLDDLRVSRAWWSGDRRRPTSRPTRLADPKIDTFTPGSDPGSSPPEAA